MKSTSSARIILGLYCIAATVTLSFAPPKDNNRVSMSKKTQFPWQGRITPITMVLSNTCIDEDTNASPKKCPEGSVLTTTTSKSKNVIERRTNIIEFRPNDPSFKRADTIRITVEWTSYNSASDLPQYIRDAPGLLSFNPDKFGLSQKIECEFPVNVSGTAPAYYRKPLACAPRNFRTVIKVTAAAFKGKDQIEDAVSDKWTSQ